MKLAWRVRDARRDKKLLERRVADHKRMLAPLVARTEPLNKIANKVDREVVLASFICKQKVGEMPFTLGGKSLVF